MDNKISIVIPIYNEESNIDFLLSELQNLCIENRSIKFEIIFVNDGSKDGTVEKIIKERGSLNCKIISLSKNYGSHAAIRAGIMHSSYDIVTNVTADLQNPLEIIPKLFEEIKKGFDLVLGQREKIKYLILEGPFSKFYAWLMQNFAIPEFPKSGFDLMMFNKKIKKSLNNNIESNSSVFIHALSLGFSHSSVFYNKKERSYGKSKWTIGKKLKLVIDSFVSFSYFPIRLVSIMGILFFFIGIIWTGHIIFRKLYFNDLDTGWPALVSILMIGFGITNIGIGIVAEYLWRTLDASRKRPVFIIDDIMKLNKE